MRFFSRNRDRDGGGRINMTPMIDVTFLLLTFFMLASHYASAEKTDVFLPRPDENQAVDERLKDKVIISLLFTGPMSEAELRMGPLIIPSAAELQDRLERVARQNAGTQVILRADRRLPYGEVRRVIEMVSAAGLSHLRIVTDLGES